MPEDDNKTADHATEKIDVTTNDDNHDVAPNRKEIPPVLEQEILQKEDQKIHYDLESPEEKGKEDAISSFDEFDDEESLLNTADHKAETNAYFIVEDEVGSINVIDAEVAETANDSSIKEEKCYTNSADAEVTEIRHNVKFRTLGHSHIAVSDEDQQPKSNRHQMRKRAVVSNHRLVRQIRGESEVEQMARRIELRYKNRIVVSLNVKIAFIRDCRKIAIDKPNHSVISRIGYEDLLEYKDSILEKLDREKRAFTYQLMYNRIGFRFGFRSHTAQLLQIIDKALSIGIIEQDAILEQQHFYYMDFCEYHTTVEKEWALFRGGATIAFYSIIMFYVLTPLLFCVILEDTDVCVPGEELASSLYFASITLSTTGYGDLTVDKSKTLNVFFGTIYMIVANITLIVAFSAAADQIALDPFSKVNKRIKARLIGEIGDVNDYEPVYKKIKRLKRLSYARIAASFVILNAIGVIASRIFLNAHGDETEIAEWTWMISIYWAVQTTTTIGYGDLDQILTMYFFQIFYAILAAYLVGVTLSGLVTLKADVDDLRRQTSWGRRTVTKNFIDEMQPDNHNEKIDQYEFVLASLLHLGKITSEDLQPIMDKFRTLCNDTGFISLEKENIDHDVTEEQVLEALKAGKEDLGATYLFKI